MIQEKTLLAAKNETLSVNDVSVYLHVHDGRQKGGREPPIKRMDFVDTFIQEWYVYCFTNIQNSCTWSRNDKIKPPVCCFHVLSIGDLNFLPPSFYLERYRCLSCDKIYQAFPYCFSICKQSKKAGQWEGLGTRL